MNDDTPVLDVLAAMTDASIEFSSLGNRDLMIARLAALAAMDAPAVSYLLNIGPAAESGLMLEDAQGVLAAIAPIIGAPRTMAAATKLARAVGFAIQVIEAELDAELAAEEG